MRIQSALAVSALVAAFALSACSSNRSGGSATYNSGAGGYDTHAAAYAPTPTPAPAAAPSYARSGRGNTAYIFVASWCGYCQKLKSNTLSSPAVQAELANFNSQQVDPDSASGRTLASQYGIHGYPTTVIVSPSGTVVKKIVGYNEPNDYIAQLRSAR